MADHTFLRQRTSNGYKNLLVFQKAECIYDVTVYFAGHYINPRSRTYDQMVQAARSLKQNIVEGYIDGMSSKKSEIHLTDIARGSLHELLLDFEDYLRIADSHRDKNRSNETLISYTGDFADRIKKACKAHCDSSYYIKACERGNDEQIVNMAITLIHQEDLLLANYLEYLKKKFLEEGGASEEMTRARIKNRQNK